MVRLDRIAMQGFKSFAGRVVIPFPSGFNCICGPNGSGKCASYDTLITLSDGSIVKLGEVVENRIKESSFIRKLDDGVFVDGDGTEIVSLDKNLKTCHKQIKAFIKRTAPEKMLFIKTRSGREIKCTNYHPFFSIGNNGVFSLEAKDLKNGVKIAVPRIIKTKTSLDESKEIFNSLYVPYSEELENIVRDEIEKKCITYKEFASQIGIPENSIKGLMDKQSIRHDHISKIISNCNINYKLSELKSKNYPKTFHTPELTEELSRFLGYMISEGSSTLSHQLWFVNDDEKIIEDFVDICSSQFGLEAKIFSYKGDTKDVIVFSKPLQVWLDSIYNLKINSKSAEKNVPEKILKGSENIIINFLSALFEGDGYFNISYFEYATASKKLAFGVQHLLLRLGILSNIKTKEKYASNTINKTKRTYYSVYVYGEQFNELCKKLNIIGRKKVIVEKIKALNVTRNPNIDTVPNINEIIKYVVQSSKISIKKNRGECPKLAAYYENRCECSRQGLKEIISFIRSKGKLDYSCEILLSQLELIADSDIFWDEIIQLNEIETEEWVYDLTVDETHNYIANNFFIHNSNTIDALTFVLGTSSARSIRADKLQNLIFNGAKDKKPAEFCEVSLYIDNSDSKIPGHEKEVKITRKVNRSGVSIYKVDGKTETRAKIVDLLANASITPDGYNIIMQGDVTRIIEMNSIERRQILDDISGISEFDDKKEKASKELEKVETRIRENMIVLAEKQNLVAKLKAEKENAEKYEKYSSDLKKSKASLLKKRLDETGEKHEILSKEIEADTKVFDGFEKEFREVEKELEKNEKEIQKSSNELISKSRNYDVLRKIDTLNNEILRKEDKIELNERELQRLNATNIQEQKNYAVSSILKLGYPEIYGTIASLIEIPKKYSTAISVALGKHTSDVVVENDDTATQSIKYLKENKIGRVRFLPLNRIQYREQKKYEGKEKILGYAVDLINFDHKYDKALQITLKNTIVVDNVDIAKRIRNFRVVTLDGDLAEESGAMIGGFLRRNQIDHSSEINKIESENEKIQKEIEKMQEEIEKLRGLEKEETEEVTKLQTYKEGSEKKVEELRLKFKKIQEERLILQSKISRNKIEKARVEAGLDNIKIEYDEYKDVKEFLSGSVEELQERVRRCLIEINKLGPVNMKAIEEFKNFNVEFEELKKKLDKMLEEKDAILKVVQEVESRRFEKFMSIFKSVTNNFTRIYSDLTGGAGSLRLEIENSIDSGLVIEASPVGKKVLNLDSMSGGEKTMTSLAFLFAVMQHYSSPFYVLDEIDAALDKSNTKKIVNLVKKYSNEVQFIVISHNDTTIGDADKVFGVSMEDGVSKVFGIDMPEKNL